jgi:hypothetical protein
LSDGDREKPFHTNVFQQKYGWDSDTCQKIAQYLEDEGLIHVHWHEVGNFRANIKHAGIVQVENALLHPVAHTQYFPPVSQIVFNVSGDVTIGGDVIGRDQNQMRIEGKTDSA